ncbi:hypothetical protein ACFU8Q_32430 [Streptomyces sp. NPDC057543]|uniref:hypothetical protein n=1 Tax=Streptomyces sp. NPDC057543 TaxID=3346163 RepID=UPI00369061C0
MGILLLDEEAGDLGLGQQCVEGDHVAGEVERGEEGLERADLVRLGRHLLLGEDDAVHAQGGHEVDSGAIRAERSTQGLSVHGDLDKLLFRPGAGFFLAGRSARSRR